MAFDPLSLVGFGIPALIKFFGELGASGQKAEQARLNELAAQQYGDENLSPIEQSLLKYLTEYQVDDSELAKLEGDKEAISQQNEVLAQLRQLLSAGGRDAQYLQDVQGATDAVAGQRQSADLEMQKQLAAGMSPSQAAALAQGQSANANMAGNRLALGAMAGASNREMDAIRAYANMLDNMRRQSFSEKETAARGADAISMFNAQARRGAYNDRLKAQMDAFSQRMRLADGRAGAYREQAGAANSNAYDALMAGERWGNRFGALGADILGGLERDRQKSLRDYEQWSAAWDKDFNKRYW